MKIEAAAQDKIKYRLSFLRYLQITHLHSWANEKYEKPESST